MTNIIKKKSTRQRDKEGQMGSFRVARKVLSRRSVFKRDLREVSPANTRQKDVSGRGTSECRGVVEGPSWVC